LSEKLFTLADMYPNVQIKQSKIVGAGRGVFATQKIKEGQLFLIDPIVFVKKTEVANYIYQLGKNKYFVALGPGSLINHSLTKDCCMWTANEKTQTISFIATKDIKKGAEIFHSYGWDSYPDGW
jgi:SET domain